MAAARETVPWAPVTEQQEQWKEPQMSEGLEPTPVALYARVSSDRQDVDLSVAAQLRALTGPRREERPGGRP